MRHWSLALLAAGLALPLAVLAQSGGSGSAQPQIEVQPLGQGYVLQGGQAQTQGALNSPQQGETNAQVQAETTTEPQDAQQAIAASAVPQAPPREAKGVSLEGLDKITARTFAFEAPLNETVRFGYLEITARRCVVAAEEEAPERAAFLEVVEAKPGRNPSRVFSGWMFASSPSVSAMEHAVYDIWVVDCTGYEGEASVDTVPEVEAAPEEVEAPVEGVERPLD